MINDNINTEVSGGQFFSFTHNACYESDYQGVHVGNGTSQFSRTESGINVYAGTTYYGQSVVKVKPDLSKINVICNGNIYVYERSPRPSNVTTCSLIKSSSPATSWPSYIPAPFYPVENVPNQTFDNGGYNNGNSGSVVNSQPSQTPQRRRCAFCNGTGRIARNDNAPASFGNNRPRQQCSECGQWYDPTVFNHYHVQCSHCGGTGWAR